MQLGSIRKHHGNWVLFYYDTVIRDGTRKRVRLSRKLARVGKEFPSVTSVRYLADDILGPINRRQVQPESSLLITEYIEQYYFPAIEKELRPSTVLNYRVSIYEKHLKHRLARLRMRDVRPVHFQRMLREIHNVSHLTLLHIKNFLSGVFRFARREGVLEGLNPLLDVTVPGRQKRFDGAAYSINDIERMLEDITDDTAVEVIVLLAWTGLRQSEARGLRWSDWNEQAEVLNIRRSVWQTRVGPTKNPQSEDVIPVLPILADLLRTRRERIRPRADDYIFAGVRRGTPLNFHNLENRVIKPSLERAQLNNEVVVDWQGYHGFRRGLATNLIDLGVHPKVVAGILRHSDVATTMRFYVKERTGEARNALERLQKAIRNRPSNVTVNGRKVSEIASKF